MADRKKKTESQGVGIAFSVEEIDADAKSAEKKMAKSDKRAKRHAKNGTKRLQAVSAATAEADGLEYDEAAAHDGRSPESDVSDAETDGSDAEAPLDPDFISLANTVKSKVKAAAAAAERSGTAGKEEKGVIYIGHIPHGFYEKAMRMYFSQFGDVTRLRMSKNKMTGRSKHYAFLEFASADVARIVAEAVDGQFIAEHLLKCAFVPPEKVHEDTFKNCDRIFKKRSWKAMQRRQLQRRAARSMEDAKNTRKATGRREDKRRKRIADAGIEYEY